MKINIAKSAGFCFGVRRAVNIALETAETEKKIDMLGDIVHNEEVVKKIRQKGIKKIKKLNTGKNKTLLIRAHGSGRKTIEKALKLGYKVVDATCPMVKEIHKIVRKMEKKGFFIIIIGDKKHDEVYGIIGQLKNKAIVIDNPGNIPIDRLKKIKKACVVVQSTQIKEKAEEILKILNVYVKNIKFFDTICRPTQAKQKDIRTMPLENDVMIIIGSKKSANTRRLQEISKSLNEHSFWVRSKKDIKKAWFRGARTVGITAGSSTPDSTTQDVIKHIRKIT